jgi:hypothetical protein
MARYQKHERGFSRAGVRIQEPEFRSEESGVQEFRSSGDWRIGVLGFSDGFDSATPATSELLKLLVP